MLFDLTLILILLRDVKVGNNSSYQAMFCLINMLNEHNMNVNTIKIYINVNANFTIIY